MPKSQRGYVQRGSDMAEHSHIEWTDATWNPVTGCSIVSPGCTNCYAMGLAATRLKHHPSRKGLTREVNGNHVWTGQVRFNEQWIRQPLTWRRPRMIFVCAHGDLFHEDVPFEWVDRVFAVMALSPQHTFQVLTKRAARARAYLTSFELDGHSHLARRGVNRFTCGVLEVNPRIWPLTNVWLGVSVERQQEADARIPDLLATPAAVRFVSAEPLLGPIDFNLRVGERWHKNALTGSFGGIGLPAANSTDRDHLNGNRLDWIIVGGESGDGARPMHPDWARSIRDQCITSGTPYFFKQWGAWLPSNDDVNFADGNEWADRHFPRCEVEQHSSGHTFVKCGKARAGRMLDGRTWDEFPNTTTRIMEPA